MKKKIAVIYGGANTEHEVSISSATSIIKHLDPKKYHIYPILITKNNHWLLQSPTSNPFEINPFSWIKKESIDICFPILHGKYGEDGSIQGMCEMLQIPYVGCSILSSALCIDKVIQKQLCSSANIPQVKYLWYTQYLWQFDPNKILSEIISQLQLPLFIKPASSGSSIGVTKVSTVSKMKSAIETSLKFDSKIIIEEAVAPVHEIECSIIGANSPKASVLGEIISAHDFYDYDAKYCNSNSRLEIPAKLTPALTQKITSYALKAYQLLQCDSLARVDFFLDQNNKIYLNEINTMPGFTPVSMYPKLWQQSGLSYPALLDQLIKLGLNRYQATQSLSSNLSSN